MLDEDFEVNCVNFLILNIENVIFSPIQPQNL